MASVFRFFSSAIDLDPLLPRLESRKDAHVALCHPVVQSEKFDQGLVRLAVDRARGEAHLDAFAVAAGKFRARSAWLNVQLQDHRDATVTKKPRQAACARARSARPGSGPRAPAA